jgi:DNA-directed RNA polymerase specialized sigma24 family protein
MYHPVLASEKEAVVDAQGSITVWIGRLKAGDAAAATPLWENYFTRVVNQARRKLGGKTPVAADEEDVALSAFDSFFRRAQEGRFPNLDDRDDLWKLLMAITARKAFNLVRNERREKRGGGNVRQASALTADREADAFADILGTEPTPELAAQVAEECQRLLTALGDAELRAVAVAKMEGWTNAEIAEQRGASVATVERKLNLIRKRWQREAVA